MGQPMGQPMGQTMMGNTMMNQNMGQPVNVQPAQFSAFAGGNLGNYQPENIDLIMDVPLQVTVELGRTQNPFQIFWIWDREKLLS